MVTGDHKAAAIDTARVLGLGTLIAGPQGLPVLRSRSLTPSLGFLVNNRSLAFQRDAVAHALSHLCGCR
jgi:hypothetical protein